MNRKQLIGLFLGLACLSSAAFAVETEAKHAYLIDATTGAVLLDKDGDMPMVPSSMSKLMTAYIAFERLKEKRIKPEDMLTVSEKAWRMQGSKTFVKVGDQVSVDSLIHGIIVQSGNDACIVMAEGIAGSEEAFVAEMNKKAQELGLKDSHFVNATGWPDEGHVMSARDLAVLAHRIISDFPEYYPLYSTKEYTFNNITQFNRNRLLGVNGVDGLKTGHTDAGGYGIVLSAQRSGRRLILVINGLTSDNARVKEGDMLLRWGFNSFDNKTLVKAAVEIARIPVWLGSRRDISLMATSNVVVTYPVGGDAASEKYTIRYKRPVAAPVAKGTHIADLVILSRDGTTQTVPLVAGEDVAKQTGFAKAWSVIKYYITGMKQ